MIQIPNRTDLGRRARKKSLQKLVAKKRQEPDKFVHEMNEYSIYLGLDWDFKHKQINVGKIPEYEALKNKYGNVQTKHGC